MGMKIALPALVQVLALAVPAPEIVQMALAHH